MSREEIKLIIEKEISDERSLSPGQKDNTKKYLVDPLKEKYVSDFHPTKTFELWTVYEQNPGSEKNTVIFYDEEEKNFGLGMKINGRNCYWANYGSFIKTLKGM